KSAATGTLATPTGQITLTSHACSGGGPGFGGQANGNANGDITLDYAIVSPTLPAGTPVQVSVRWAVNSNVKAVGEDMQGANTSAYGAASGQVRVFINGAIVSNLSGTYSSRHNVPDGYYVGNSGSLNVGSDSGTNVYTVLIGQNVRVYMSGNAASASAVEAGTTDGDVQMAMMWGVTSLTADTTAVLADDHAEHAPPAENATPERVVLLTPPRPTYPGILPCFRIPTQPTPALTCHASSATFSIAPLGTGPFT